MSIDGIRGQYFSALFSIQVIAWVDSKDDYKDAMQRAMAQTDFLIPPWHKSEPETIYDVKDDHFVHEDVHKDAKQPNKLIQQFSRAKGLHYVETSA